MDVGSISAAVSANPAQGPAGLRSLLHDPSLSNAQRTKEAARQFEATLLRTFLNDALKPMLDGALKEGGSANGIYRQHLVDAIADSVATGQDLGFQTLVQQQLATQGGDPR
jgi:Rod binding domain-containing protein